MIPFIEAIRKQYPGAVVLVRLETCLCAYEKDAVGATVFNSPIENHALGRRACVEMSRKPLLELRQRNIGYVLFDNGQITLVFMANRYPSKYNQKSTSISNSVRMFNASALSSTYKKKSRLDRLAELKACFPNTLFLFKDGGIYFGYDETAVVMDLSFKIGYMFSNNHRVASYCDLNHMTKDFVSKGLRYVIDDGGTLSFHSGRGFKLQNPLNMYPKTKSSSFSKSTRKFVSN